RAGAGLPRRRELVGLLGRDVALRPRRGRDEGEPDDALARDLLLERLHVAALVVLAHVRTVVVRPLEHHELAALIGEAHALAGRGRGREARSGLADLCRGGPGVRHDEAAPGDAREPGERGPGEKRATGQAVCRHDLSSSTHTHAWLPTIISCRAR